MKIRIMLSVLVLALLGSTLQADITVSTTSPLSLSFPGAPPEDPTGSEFSGGMTVFGTGFGLFLTGADLVFPGGSTGENPFLPGSDTFLDVLATPLGGGSEKLLFSWTQTPAGSSLIPMGATVNGAIVQTIGFEFGSANFGNNGVEWTPALPYTIDSTEFTLFNTAGAPLFTSTTIPAFINPDGSLGFSGFISAGGADLGMFGIGSAQVSITITKVPEPSTFALLGVAGVIGMLRRRR